MNKISFIVRIFFCLIIIELTSIKSYSDTDKLEKIKTAIEQKDLNWTAGENWVTRLSPQQRKKLVMKAYEPPALTMQEIVTVPWSDDLPSRLDWRIMSHNDFQGNYITSVKNQGQCGSCWAFSAVGQVESWWLIENDRPDTTLDLSEQTLLSGSNACSCEGGRPGEALEWIQRNGVPPEWCFEYAAADTIPLDSAYAEWKNYAYTIPGWNYITGDKAEVNNIKHALMYHPVSACFEVYTDFNYYLHGIYEPTEISGSTGTWHAILIIGWNDADSCWICKNSWGADWGETANFGAVESGAANGGYFRIKWGACHIGEYIPFIWNEVGGENYFTVGKDSIHLTLTKGESIWKNITIANSGPDDIDFAALSYAVSEKFHVDNFYPYEGTSWWCGAPETGGYANHWLQYLQTPVLDLSKAVKPELRWKGYWSIEDPEDTDIPPHPWDGWDGCNVWISTNGGIDYNVIQPEFPEYDHHHLWSFGNPYEGWNLGRNIAGWSGNSKRWTDVKFDLSVYKTENVIVRWAFASDMGYCTEDDPSLYGFFVDNIVISDRNTILFENQGENNGEMTVEGYSSEKIDWLKILNGVGTISAGDLFNISIIIDARNIEPGDYKGSVMFTISDTIQKSLNIPVNLRVIQKENLVLKLYNYPNPFNVHTKISYNLPEMSFVTLKVYNVRGQRIRTLVNKMQSPGLKHIIWDGTDEAHNVVGSGMYIYTLETNGKVLSKKMLVIR